MRILIACEFSGVVREAFNSYSGVHAVSCDLEPAEDGRVDYHHQGDVMDIISQPWDMMIAFPPCTYLCNSGVRWLQCGTNGARMAQMISACEFFNNLLGEDLMSAARHIPRIAIENPVQHRYARERIRRQDQIIQPWMFGHGETKATCLWLKGLPPLTIDPEKFVPPRAVCSECGAVGRDMRASDMFSDGCVECGAEAVKIRSRWSNQTDSGQNKLPPSCDRATKRAVTYVGIARAMATQWSNP